jgi:hypothetical protein
MAQRSWCPHPTFSAPELDAMVWADVVSLLSDPQLLLFSAWQEQHQIDKKTDLSEEELRRLKHQISDGKSQCRRLVDAYQKQAIELEELVSRRTAIEQRLESIQRIIDGLAAEPIHGLSFADLERNIDEVGRSLSGRLQGMDMNGRMSLCRDLIDKVVVDNYNVEIHYKFPLSGNSNTKRERPTLQLQGLPSVSFMLPEAHPAVRRVRVSRLVYRMIQSFSNEAAGRRIQSAAVIAYASAGDFVRFNPHLCGEDAAVGCRRCAVPHQPVDDKQMEQINISRMDFHGEWNYTIRPRVRAE